MNVVLFDDEKVRLQLLPFTFTRPVCEIRTGILTITEKWAHVLSSDISFHTDSSLAAKFPCRSAKDNLLINGAVFPDKLLVEQLKKLPPHTMLVSGNTVIALRTGEMLTQAWNDLLTDTAIQRIAYTAPFSQLRQLWDIFLLNGEALSSDFTRITQGRESAPISKTNRVLGEHIFIEKGASVEGAFLNAQTGPIYIGKDAEVMEGAMIRGPFALCDHASVKMGAKIYGPTTIGPHCKVGGEVNNSVFLGYANKAHDGFLGNAVIGEWCNIGADSNNSNLKNNYTTVQVWSHADKSYIETGLQFCGLFMGDHSKCGINTMFNTGTVVGVSANVYGAGFPNKFIPSFSWGGATGKFYTYKISEARETARRVFERRGITFDEQYDTLFSDIFSQTAPDRWWEHKEKNGLA